MSITKSYNKQRDIHYAYETSYEWSDKAQKKVQVRRCIGHFDPETKQIVPNGKRGPKPSTEGTRSHLAEMEQSNSTLEQGLSTVNATLVSIADSLKTLTEILSSKHNDPSE